MYVYSSAERFHILSRDEEMIEVYTVKSLVYLKWQKLFPPNLTIKDGTKRRFFSVGAIRNAGVELK